MKPENKDDKSTGGDIDNTSSSNENSIKVHGRELWAKFDDDNANTGLQNTARASKKPEQRYYNPREIYMMKRGNQVNSQ